MATERTREELITLPVIAPNHFQIMVAHGEIDPADVPSTVDRWRSSLATGDHERIVKPRSRAESALAKWREVNGGTKPTAHDCRRQIAFEVIAEVTSRYENQRGPEGWGRVWLTDDAEIYPDMRPSLDHAADTALRAGEVDSMAFVADSCRCVLALVMAIDPLGRPRIEAAIKAALNGAGNKLRSIQGTFEPSPSPEEWAKRFPTLTRFGITSLNSKAHNEWEKRQAQHRGGQLILNLADVRRAIAQGMDDLEYEAGTIALLSRNSPTALGV